MLATMLGLMSALTGCGHQANQLVEATTSFRPFRSKPTVRSRPDVVGLHYIFLQRPVDDPALTQAVWSDGDEHCLPLETKKRWEENGLRVAKLGSRLSPEILDLLERANPIGKGRATMTESGGLVKVASTLTKPVFTFVTYKDGNPDGDEYSNAQGFFYITPQLGDENNVKLSLIPAVEHGTKRVRHRPRTDLSGWELKHGRESHKYDQLSISLNLASGEYALIGGWDETNATIGNRFFKHNDDPKKPTRTVLLVRAVRPSRDDLYVAGYEMDDFFLTPLNTLPGTRSPVRETILADHRRKSLFH